MIDLVLIQLTNFDVVISANSIRSSACLNVKNLIKTDFVQIYESISGLAI